MSKKFWILLLLIILGITIIYLIMEGSTLYMIYKSNKIIDKIDKYYHEYGTYPKSITELGLVETESGPIYYEKKGEKHYIVWFGTTLGESKTYDSITKKWK